MQDKSDRNYDNKEHEFLSDAVIRNSEVLYRNERTAQKPNVTYRVRAATANASPNFTKASKLGDEYLSENTTRKTLYHRIQIPVGNHRGARPVRCELFRLHIRPRNRVPTEKLNETFKGNSYKQKTILKRLRTELNDTYQLRAPKQWKETFPENTAFKKPTSSA